MPLDKRLIVTQDLVQTDDDLYAAWVGSIRKDKAHLEPVRLTSVRSNVRAGTMTRRAVELVDGSIHQLANYLTVLATLPAPPRPYQRATLARAQRELKRHHPESPLISPEWEDEAKQTANHKVTFYDATVGVRTKPALYYNILKGHHPTPAEPDSVRAAREILQPLGYTEISHFVQGAHAYIRAICPHGQIVEAQVGAVVRGHIPVGDCPDCREAVYGEHPGGAAAIMKHGLAGAHHSSHQKPAVCAAFQAPGRDLYKVGITTKTIAQRYDADVEPEYVMYCDQYTSAWLEDQLKAWLRDRTDLGIPADENPFDGGRTEMWRDGVVYQELLEHLETLVYFPPSPPGYGALLQRVPDAVLQELKELRAA